VLLLANMLVWHRGGGVREAEGPMRAAGGATRPNGGAAAGPARSIAVLPFNNLSSDEEQGYFADGISEDILDLLTKMSALRVAARTSSFSFKGRELTVQDIARQLGVANVLQGSVRRAGDEVRISVQLVHAADGYQVWSQTWDRKLDDVFAIQDEIARDVAGKLEAKLLGAAPRARPTDPRAYALFLKARELGRQRRPESMLRSDSLYRQVLALDPRYAPAWAGLSANFVNETSINVLPNEEGLRRAREAAVKALAVDPDYARAHGSLGVIDMGEGDLGGAARNLERAFVLDPADLSVLGNSGTLLRALGRLNEAIVLQEYVVARDPVNAIMLPTLGGMYLDAGRYDDAIAHYRTALALSPGFGGAHYGVGIALLLKGHAAAALAEIQQETSEAWRMLGLSMVSHALGRSRTRLSRRSSASTGGTRRTT